MPSVTIRLLSDDPSPVPVEGVVVQFFDTGAVFQTEGTTDADGEVVVLLPDGSYDVLMYKVGVSIPPKQPQRIIVDTLLVNIFEVVAHVRTRPESVDPIRCTVSGYILGVDGKQARHRLIFEPCKDLLVISNNVIAPLHRVEVTSTEDGYFEFELLRGVTYLTYFVFPEDFFMMQPGKLTTMVPDQASVALDALLYPLPIHMDFSATTISLPLGGEPDESIDADLSFSDGSERTTTSTPWAGITTTNTDATVVTAALRFGKLSLTPCGPGTATITTVREIPTKVFFDPLPEYTSESVVVTVA